MILSGPRPRCPGLTPRNITSSGQRVADGDGTGLVLPYAWILIPSPHQTSPSRMASPWISGPTTAPALVREGSPEPASRLFKKTSVKPGTENLAPLPDIISPATKPRPRKQRTRRRLSWERGGAGVDGRRGGIERKDEGCPEGSKGTPPYPLPLKGTGRRGLRTSRPLCRAPGVWL